MRVLILGGYGFIGLEAARRLLERHSVTGIGRSTAHGARILPEARWIQADISKLATADAWIPLLANIDVVVNASGALQDGARDQLMAVQDVSIRALISACERAGVRRFVQISAPGATAHARTQFLFTKAVADTALKQSSLDWVILRPGLVWGRTASGGTALVRMLSAAPIVQPLMLANACVQMVDIDDVSDAIALSVDGGIPAGTDAALVEPSPRALSNIVATVRAWHGFAPARTRLNVPRFLGQAIAWMADLAGWLGWRSPLRSTSLRALEQGVVDDPAAWRQAGGTPPADFEQSLRRRPATRQDRVFARTQLILPLVIVCLSAFWITSGLVGFAQLDQAANVIASSVDGPEHYVIAGAFADIALGLGLLWRPWARAACFGMIGLTLAYLAAGTLLTPHLWSDPLGPFVKALPAAMLALVCATLLEQR